MNLIVLVIYVKCNYETIFVITAVLLDDSVAINVNKLNKTKTITVQVVYYKTDE
jgi:hypothetical protein